MATYRNRYKCAVSGAPGTAGAFAVSAAQLGFKTFASADNALSFDVLAVDGTAWELRQDCVYTHATTTLTRGTLIESSTGAAVNLTANTLVAVPLAAQRVTDLATKSANETISGSWSFTNGIGIGPSGVIDFANSTDKKIEWWAGYDTGLQSNTVYQRAPTTGYHAWFSGGVHSDTALDPGTGGTRLGYAGLAAWNFEVPVVMADTTATTTPSFTMTSATSALGALQITNTPANINTANNRALQADLTIQNGDVTAGRVRYGAVFNVASYENGVLSTAVGTAITAGSYASRVITLTAPGHTLAAGGWVKITGCSPVAYDGCYEVLTVGVPTANDFTVACSGPGPGAFVSGGSVYPYHGFNETVYGSYSGVTISDNANRALQATAVGARNVVTNRQYCHTGAMRVLEAYLNNGAAGASIGDGEGLRTTYDGAINITRGCYAKTWKGSYNLIDITNRSTMEVGYGVHNKVSVTGTYAYLGTYYWTYNQIDRVASGVFAAAYGTYTAFSGTITTKVGFYQSGADYSIMSDKLRIGDTAIPTEALEVVGNVIATGAIEATGGFTGDLSGEAATATYALTSESIYIGYDPGGDTYLTCTDATEGLDGYLTAYTSLKYTHSTGTLTSGSFAGKHLGLDGNTTHDFGSIAANRVASTTITVTGAALGDFVLVSCSSALETGCTLFAYVSATNTVTLMFENTTAAAVDPASRTYYVRILAR